MLERLLSAIVAILTSFIAVVFADLGIMAMSYTAPVVGPVVNFLVAFMFVVPAIACSYHAATGKSILEKF